MSSAADAISRRLKSKRPLIEKMMSSAGTAGLTYGVIHKGEVIQIESIGYRDVEKKLPIDEDTVFVCASLTKSMIAASIGMLVEEERLDWDTPLRTILPDWHVKDSVVRNNVTIVDCLAHRTGLQKNNYWLESNNNIIIPLEDSMKMLNGLVPVRPFRSSFQYNNLGYEVAGHVIQKLSGLNWGEFVKTRIFDPLSMSRSGTREGFCSAGNFAESYAALSDGTPVKIKHQQIGDNTVAGAAGGARSTMRDLLTYMKVWLSNIEHQFSANTTATPGSPLKQVGEIVAAKIPTGKASLHETSACWIPTGFPRVGKGTPSQIVLYHKGSNPGTLHTVNLLPELQSGIVVLTNILALNDCADWVGQLLLEEYLDVGDKNDYYEVTKDTVSRALAWYPAMEKELRQVRDLKIPQIPLEFLGVHWNVVGTVHIDVAFDGKKLVMMFQDLADETGIFALGTSPDYYKIKFGRWEAGHVERLNWIHEGWNIPEGEEFFKKSDTPHNGGNPLQQTLQ